MIRTMASLAACALLACGTTGPDEPWSLLEGNWVSSAPIQARTSPPDPVGAGPFPLRLSLDGGGGGSWSWGRFSYLVYGSVFTGESVSLILEGPSRSWRVLFSGTYQDERLVGAVSGSAGEGVWFEDVPVTLVRER